MSFIIVDILNWYEHQSTFNPNMPLRGLFYITNIYKNIVGNDVDIYSSRQIELPLPKYIVFYNGAKCGASAPDHFHFQAGLKTNTLLSSENSLRSCLRIESDTKEDAEEQFYYVFDYLKTHQPDEEEPMMNIISFMEKTKYIIHIFPRKLHRPWQYSAEDKTDRKSVV